MFYDIKINDGNCYFDETININDGIELTSHDYKICIYFNDEEYVEEICIERHSGDQYKVWLTVKVGDDAMKKRINGFQYDIFGGPCFVTFISHKLMTESSITNKIKELVKKYQSFLKQSGY